MKSIGSYQNAHSQTLPAGDSFYINILWLNNAGEITTTIADSSGNPHGLLIDGGTFTQIDVPGAASTFAFGINDLGEIVGRYKLNGVIHGYLDQGGQFTTIDVPGAADTWVTAINDRGDIAGFYDDAAGTYHGFFGQAVPEPGAMALMAFLITLSLLGRPLRRMRRS